MVFFELVSSTYQKEGSPNGRGPLADNYHGARKDDEFVVYTMSKDVTKMDVVEWDPTSDCLISATSFCSNCQRVAPLQSHCGMEQTASRRSKLACASSPVVLLAVG